MPQKTDLNVNPYFDDFDANNQYYRILFKPSVPVQARELTQVQSMLQNQIEQLASLNLRNGDIVSGCAINDIPVLPFIRLSDFQSNGAAFNLSALVNTQVVSTSSNLTARVLFGTSGQASQYPNTNVIYLKYINTGSNATSNQVTAFSNTDQLVFYKIPRTGNNTADTLAIVNAYPSNSTTAAVGNAHGISVSEGVVFLSGCLVQVLNPTFGVVNATGTYASNLVVGFIATEAIINSNQDTALLDNALGYSNENAPGADRLKILPGLIALDPLTAANTAGFNPIVQYNFGSIISSAVAGSNLYSIVESAIAKNINDEAGNYVVNPFAVDSVTNVPGNTIVANLSTSNYLTRIAPGLGYAQGYKVELLKTAYIQMRRGTDTQVSKSQQVSFNYGGYFVLQEVAGYFPFANAATIQLYANSQQAVTNRTFTSVAPTGTLIGNAAMRCFSYNNGIPGSNTAQYILHVYNIQLANGFNSSQIHSVYYNGTSKGVGDIVSQGLIGASFDDQLYSFGATGIKSLRDSGNNNNTEYVYRTVNTGTMATTGNIVITIPTSQPGGVDILPYGTGNLTDSQAAYFTLVATANVDTANLAGTVSSNTVNTAVIGTGTTFLTDFNVGSNIKVNAQLKTVTAITNNTLLNVDTAFTANVVANTYVKSFINGKIIPIQQGTVGKPALINVTNTTSFTIVSNEKPVSSLSVVVYYDVMRTNASPAQKVINKSRFVCINTANNVGGPNGPWCLGLSDVHKVRKIWGTSNGSYTVNGTDLTSSFSWDTGQTDTNYGLAYIYPKTAISANCLLVQLDYFAVNTAPGVGFFTVESYPIDDVNTSNNSGIQTQEIPVYFDGNGSKNFLRDMVDFRTPCSNTAADTGFVDISNTTQVTTGVAAATVNPSTTLTFNIPAAGINNPSFGRNLQADFTRYLPRKDLLFITPDNILKVKEGVSQVNPQTPLYPDGVMVLSVINVPPYPSLTTDQADGLLAVNQSSKNMVRDLSTTITSSLVTNRRYTMRDIGVLDQRISNLEYYQQLSLLEKQASSMTVTDQNGLDRFKNGIFVEPFSDFTLSDVTNPEYSIAIDQAKGYARPKINREVLRIRFNTSASPNVTKTGRLITLPYAEVTFMSQPYSTKYRSAALVAYAWNGTLILMPTYDNHQDLNNTGSVNMVVDNATPWQQFSNTPFASIWGDWRTTTSVASNTVTTGHQDVTTVVNNVYVTNTVYQYVNGGVQVIDAGAATATYIWDYSQSYAYNIQQINNFNSLYAASTQFLVTS
jgi:hypothetical protein